MSHYIFKFPEAMPELNFEGLSAWLGKRDSRRLGQTVVIRKTALDLRPGSEDVIHIRLYDLDLAQVFADRVVFTSTDDPHHATTEWISRIVRDNAIGVGVCRVRRRKADGPGPEASRGRAGLLVINGDRDRKVIGHAYPVDPARIERQRQADREWREQFEAANAEYAAEAAIREGLKAWEHPVFGRIYALDGNGLLSHGYHWRVVDGSFYDTVGFIRDTRVGLDASPWDASPYPGPEPVFVAFAGGWEHRADAFGPFGSLHEALAAIAGRVLYDSIRVS